MHIHINKYIFACYITYITIHYTHIYIYMYVTLISICFYSIFYSCATTRNVHRHDAPAAHDAVSKPGPNAVWFLHGLIWGFPGFS